MNCGSIRNRKHLPRHIYLHFYTLFEPDIVPQWIHALRRPHGVGFGLKSLCGPAQNAWDQGDQQGAISAQAANGRATVEIYFIGGSRP
ncbi:hypothetical protein DB30_04146 [Enhygromyxa salina]|uniref:Uncharacterized protein n=1 Tax=Enhygromyxa salina TaxID=215803 RepID=A0A0C2DA84_9BACT|nr:hypothetical protein DB30_04146 [Enhygromyxa salina]